MINLRPLVKATQKALSDNAPTILAGLATAGVITTAVFTGKATFKAADVVREHRIMKIPNGETVKDLPKLTAKEAFQDTWRLYVPAAATSLLTIACIIGSNRIGMRRAAALASAYTIVQQNFDTYKDKVVEKLGEEKEKEVRQEIAQDRVNEIRPPVSLHIVGKQCRVLDLYTGRYFVCTPDILKEAEIKIGLQIIHDGYATLSDFYNLIGVSHTSISDEVGWNTDHMFEIVYDTTQDPDDHQPVLTIDFRVKPIRDCGSTY